VLIVGVALGAISVAAVRLAKIWPFLLVGWCWYLGTLVPVIGLVQVGMQSMADRYTYIPLIGIFIIAVWGAAEFTGDWPARNKAVAAALVLAACGWCTWWQVRTWSSSEALYRHAVEAERYNSFALHGLGLAYWKEGKLDDAQQQFEAMLNPKSDPGVHVEGGLEPAHRALGLLLAVRHQPKKALEQFDAAIQVRPQQPEPFRHKAWLLATSLDENVRDGKKAVQCAEQALEKSHGKQPEYWDTLAAAQAEAGQFTEAVESAEKALEQARIMQADDLLPGIQQRLELFQSGVPYHAEARPPQRL
jgi:tetratricopeptide (TPR) repeat protein